ncbi:MAG: TetR/AcrR family transcriptional regulator [Actinomycetota bacterium]|nr:TetR/AcrR family transcriptional regulator [Actinomycetota bacterium]
MTTRQRRSREDVVRAAGRLFARRGYHGTSMRDLGDELGLLGSSLYSHVGGKEELLVEVIGRGAERFQALVEEVLAWEERPGEQLRRLVLGHVRFIIENLDEAAVFLNEARFLSPKNQRRVVEMRDRYEAAYREVLGRGVTSGDFRPSLDISLATIAILSMLNSVARWYRPTGPKSPEEVARGLFEFILEGVT